MAFIQERESGGGRVSYRVQVRLKGFPVQSATFERKTDAKRWAQQVEAAIREGRHFKTSEAKRRTLAELVDRYIREVLPRRPKSAVKLAALLGWWRRELGAYSLSEVSPALIAERRDQLLNEQTYRKKLRSPATANRYLAALSHALNVAVREWGWLEVSPVSRVDRPREPRGRVRFLSDEERARLLEACRASRTSHLYPVVVLALSTGARQGEILSLRWSHVNLRRQVIVLEETKNGERRALPLAGTALALVHGLSKVRRLDTDLLFPRPDGKKPFSIQKPWEAALKVARIEDFRFHDLRHSAASYLAMSGATLTEIAEILGHKTLSMVKRYSHLSEQHTSRVVASMNEKFLAGA
jgi:integrase